MSILLQVQGQLIPILGDREEDIRETQPETAFTQDIQVRTTQSIEYDYKVVRKAGALPSEIEDLGSAAQFEAELIKDRSGFENFSAVVLAMWTQNTQGSYRRLLASESLFTRSRGVFGYNCRCEKCQGARHFRCDACNGHGTLICGNCSGSGKRECGNCGGLKTKTCPSCHGTPIRHEYVNESVWNPKTNTYDSRSRPVDVHCQNCNLTGRVQCSQCDQYGKVTCSRCDGSGGVNCSDCGTKGQIACATCAATGVESIRGTVFANISVHDELFGTIEKPKLQDIIINRIPVDSLAEYGRLTQLKHVRGADSVVSEYALTLDIQEANIQYGRDEFTLYGFGEDSEVFDFSNIFDNAQSVVLGQFRDAIESGGMLSFGRAKTLVTAFDKFRMSRPFAYFAAHPRANRQEVQAQVEQSRGKLDSTTAVSAQVYMWRMIMGLLDTALFKCAIVLLLAIAAMFWFTTHGSSEPCGIWPRIKAVVYTLPLLLVFDFGARGAVIGRLRHCVAEEDIKAVLNERIVRWRVTLFLAMVAVSWGTFYLVTNFAYAHPVCR